MLLGSSGFFFFCLPFILTDFYFYSNSLLFFILKKFFFFFFCSQFSLFLPFHFGFIMKTQKGRAPAGHRILQFFLHFELIRNEIFFEEASKWKCGVLCRSMAQLHDP